MAACQAVGDVAVTCGTPARQVPRDGRKSRTTQPKRDRSGIALGGARDAIVFDGAVQVGDVLKVGEMVGTVDEIGLRSTRIRTPDRTIVSIPNGQIATVTLETMSERDKFWFRHVIGLRYETTPAQLRTIIEATRAMIAEQPRVEVDSVRVRLLRFGTFSLDIEVFAYFFASDWNAFLEI